MEKVNLHIEGSHGQLAATLFRPNNETHRIAIVMHGFMASQRFKLIRQLRDMLVAEGIAVLTFDFNGHGKSDGRFQDMTVLNELEDAERVFEQVTVWSWVKEVYLIGHSQGGVITGLMAGKLGKEKVKGVVQLAPAAVLHDDAIEGHIMNAKFDPKHIPDYVRVFFIKKVGRCYFEVAQKLDIFDNSCVYDGPVCLIHGKQDKVVPYDYAVHYNDGYKRCDLHLLENEGHMLNGNVKEILNVVREFVNR